MWLEILGVFITVTLLMKFALGSQQKKNKNISKKKTIPGMKPSHPETGNKTEKQAAKSPGHFICDLHRKYGPIASFWDGKLYCVSVSEPKMFKQLRHLFLTPIEAFEEFALIMDKETMAFCEIEEIRRRRKLYEQHFLLKACKSYSNTFSQIANEYVKKWENLGEGETVPLVATTARASLAAMSRTTYGDIFEDEKKLDRFHELNDYIFQHLFPTPAVDSPVYKQMMENKEEMKRVVKEAIERRKQTKKNNEDRIFLDVLIEEDLTEEQCLADGFLMISAGYQTSATHMAWTLYHLSKNSEFQDKLYQDIISVVGDGPITMEDIPKMKYLKQVLDEGLRLFVYYNFTARKTHEDLELDGYFIPKGTIVYMAVGCPMQDSNNFFQHDAFNPEHFNEENSRSRNAFTFKPFGFAGKRECLGKTFAMSEGSIFLAEWCRHFRFQLAPGQKDTVGMTPIFRPEEEVWVTIKKRA